MRLIDADELLKTIKVQCCESCNHRNGVVCKICEVDSFKRIVEEQPTAYEPNKVVEQLEKRTKHHYDWDISDNHYFMARGLEEAIEIVKEGGIYD